MAKCIQCNTDYEAKRASSRFCSPNCRVKYNRLSVTEDEVSVTDISVTSLSVTEPELSVTEQSVTEDPYPGGPNCQCMMCQQNRTRTKPLIINHGQYKQGFELAENEVNRVPLPGDIDYAQA